MVNSRTETPLYFKSLSEADQGERVVVWKIFSWGFRETQFYLLLINFLESLSIKCFPQTRWWSPKRKLLWEKVDEFFIGMNTKNQIFGDMSNKIQIMRDGL